MKKPEILLIGAGGHASSCIDVIETQEDYVIAGLIGLPNELGSSVFGYEVIAVDYDLQLLADSYQYALVVIGQLDSPAIRIRSFQLLTSLGFKLPSIVSPKAYVSTHAEIGCGSIVMHGAIVNAGVRLGQNCIVNSRALIEHDAVVEDHCHISTGSILNGGVAIGSGSFIGSGSVVKEGVTVGSDCVIGMGLSVLKDQRDNTRFLG